VETAPADALPAPQATGLAATLAGLCAEPMTRLGDPEVVRQFADRAAAAVGAAAAPDSPLSSWRAVLDMITQPPQRGSVARADGPGPEQRLAAFERFLQLAPPRALAALWLRPFEALRRDYPNLRGMARIAAIMHVAAGSPDAPRLAESWVVTADGDPEALGDGMAAGGSGGAAPLTGAKRKAAGPAGVSSTARIRASSSTGRPRVRCKSRGLIGSPASCRSGQRHPRHQSAFLPR
jgi:hypothetical protein